MRQLFVLFLLCVCLAPAKLRAQSDAGSDVLTGRVTDYNGRPVADAQVGVTAPGSGLTRSHATDAEGRYKIYFPELAPRYVLQVKRMGFSPVQRNVTRRTKGPEWMTIDMQLGGAPLALSMVEINGSSDAPIRPREGNASFAGHHRPKPGGGNPQAQGHPSSERGADRRTQRCRRYAAGKEFQTLPEHSGR